MTMATRYHIGCQSWGYDDWITEVGGPTVFYPAGTKKSEMLRLYSRVFETIEVDSTAYGPPSESTLIGWCEQTDDNFTFSLKVPREITHELSLSPASIVPMQAFVERCALLGEKLGSILIQLPASFEADPHNIGNVRRTIAELIKGPRYSIEFRNSGWFKRPIFDLTAENGVALCIVEGPWIERQTMVAAVPYVIKDHSYFRIMGPREPGRFDRIYNDQLQNLSFWSDIIAGAGFEESYFYADNHYEGHAPATVNRLARLLGAEIRDPSMLETQPALF